ncbi:hypothetical protein ACFQZZ_26385 [Nocardia sp. GCM10030253]|uniref:MmyB family transcriptional regulator n=1 Tax=Nocardia sp. GCM10030253 TaxID=3273404 RepID=UPI0036379505
MDHRLDVLAGNRLAGLLYSRPMPGLNTASHIFLEEAERGLYADWEKCTLDVVGHRVRRATKSACGDGLSGAEWTAGHHLPTVVNATGTDQFRDVLPTAAACARMAFGVECLWAGR